MRIPIGVLLCLLLTGCGYFVYQEEVTGDFNQSSDNFSSDSLQPLSATDYKEKTWSFKNSDGTPIEYCDKRTEALYSVVFVLKGNGEARMTYDIENRSNHKKYKNEMSVRIVDAYDDQLDSDAYVYDKGNWSDNQRKIEYGVRKRDWFRDNFDLIANDPNIGPTWQWRCRRRN